MKTTKLTAVATLFFSLLTFNLSAQGVGINATGLSPNASALLDLNSTNKGFLITRVDTANISSPAFGLMTLSPTDSCLYMYSGTKWMSMGGGGINCNNSGVVFPCGGTIIPVIDVTNPITGDTWMDRNLGASQVATSSTDRAAYGDLYQWGRCSDGHEKSTSSTTATQSTTDTPGNDDFITGSSDWRNPKNDLLWQGAVGINNPCPTGYRIPTEAELENERLSWVQNPINSTNDASGAFASPLKLTVGGIRQRNGTPGNVGSFGYYWCSTLATPSPPYNYPTSDARKLQFGSSTADILNFARGTGLSVRCIKN